MALRPKFRIGPDIESEPLIPKSLKVKTPWSNTILALVTIAAVVALGGLTYHLTSEIVELSRRNVELSQTISSGVGHLQPTIQSPVDACNAVDQARRVRAYNVRREASLHNYEVNWPCQTPNADEADFAAWGYFPKFSKGLQHNVTSGFVIPSAYAKLLSAVQLQTPESFELVNLSATGVRKLTNPQAGLAFELIGQDSHQYAIPAAPRFSSAVQAGEMVELYWMALLRDVNFEDYGTDPLAAGAINELNALTNYSTVSVNASNLFRGEAPGNAVGPYISQFLYLDCPFGALNIDQKILPPTAGLDFIKNWTTFIGIQNGEAPVEAESFGSTRRYMINGRDLAHWVHIDVLYQAYFQAALLLMGTLAAPLNPSNPYVTSANQMGFGTFGGPHIATFVSEVATRALHAAWYQKWFVHRRIRPEAYAGRLERYQSGGTGDFPANPFHADLLLSATWNNRSAKLVKLNSSTYLLPMAYPEGSPLHPSYAAGHATVAGACVTVLKALFDGSFVIPNPQQPTSNGSALVNYTGTPLTVEGELNKLAANVAYGRNHAGVHWKSDAIASLKLGEEVGISSLKDYAKTFNEGPIHWTFKDFEGNTVIIN